MTSGTPPHPSTGPWARWPGFSSPSGRAMTNPNARRFAAFNEEAFTPELPEALRLSAWSNPTTSHAGEVAEALRGMTAPYGTGSAPEALVEVTERRGHVV